MLLVLLNLSALLFGLWHLFFSEQRDTVALLLNLVWTLYSVFMLGAAMGVAGETRQVRRMHRVATELQTVLYLPSGHTLPAQCHDFSLSGLGLRLAPGQAISAGMHIDVGLWSEGQEHTFPAQVTSHNSEGIMGLQFGDMTHQQQIALVQCTFARAEAWKGWSNTYEANNSAHTLRDMLQMSGKGYRVLLAYLLGQLRGLWKAPTPVPTPLPAPAHTPLNYASYQAAQVHAP